MPVSTIKDCWSKFSARIRDYLEVVDAPDRSHLDQLSPSNRKRDRRTNSGVKDKRHSVVHRSNHHCQHQQRAHQLSPHNQPIQLSRSQLPAGFTKRKTSLGQIYFLDSSGQQHWYDPRVPKELLQATLNLDLLVGRLSSTWEVKQTSSGKTYYVDHLKQTTQFTDPRLVAYRDHLMNILKHARYVHTGALSSENEASDNPSGAQNPHAASTGVRSSVPTRTPTVPNKSLPSYCNNCKCSTSQQNNRDNPMTPTGHDTNSRHQCASRRPAFGSEEHRRVLMNGFRSNLNQTSHSNTLNGPLPTWFKEVAASGARRGIDCSYNVYAALFPNPPPSDQGNMSSTLTRTPQSRSGSNLMNRSESVNNLHQNSANIMISPVHEGPSLDQSVVSTSEKKELFDKISILRQELLKQQILSHTCRIDINRKRVFEDSFRVISQYQPRDLKKRLLVRFRGEEGLDYGGIAREWFYLLSCEILNPVHGLFQYTSGDIYNLQINPDSGIVYREHLSYMHFCGRVIGMAVFHGRFIEGHFTLPFYKMLLRRSITLDDIENVDPDLYRSLCWILNNDITNVIDTTFSVQHNAFGQLQEHELKEGGKNLAVTEENKHEYVTLYVNYRCRRGIEKQFEALQRGFDELIAPWLLESFDEHELELLVGGLSKINIEDWRSYTKLKNCSLETPLVKWFWDIVESYSEDKRARLLQFVTGSTRVPIQGFKALQGAHSELRPFTIHMIRNACTNNLPKSHTCFNRIDLPPYETYDKLRDKLTQAIEETIGFAIQ